MLWFAVTSALAAQGQAVDPPAGPQRQAQAMVRILRGAAVRFGEGVQALDADAAVRETRVRDRYGSYQPALLVEFS